MTLPITRDYTVPPPPEFVISLSEIGCLLRGRVVRVSHRKTGAHAYLIPSTKIVGAAAMDTEPETYRIVQLPGGSKL